MSAELTPKKVFISYSHDSEAHRVWVRSLADRFCNEGLDCVIDQYVHGGPDEYWMRWMESQVETADFVVLVCTEVYLQRFKGNDTLGGRGVNFEGVVIGQVLYDDFMKNTGTKFIPVLPPEGSIDHVPRLIKGGNCYQLPEQYDVLYRVLTGQPAHIKPETGQVRQLPLEETPVFGGDEQQPVIKRISIDHLPTTVGKFFGREIENELLEQAWSDPGTRIVQFVAAGGTGKTALLRNWLDAHVDEATLMVAWSFYSQGSSEGSQTSARPFFDAVLRALGHGERDFGDDTARGEFIAEAFRGRKTLLILDGLEPLQHPSAELRGRLRDKGMHALLRQLALSGEGLCVITTRIAVEGLAERAAVCSVDLGNLATADGVALLRAMEVAGMDKHLERAVEEYGHHALALRLLGSAVQRFCGGRIDQRDTLQPLFEHPKNPEYVHAWRVMQAHANALADSPELALLQLLGLFDHPVDNAVLQHLWDQQIPNLTADIDRYQWQAAIAALQSEHHLLNPSEGDADQLDAHPLIREYFGQHLKQQLPVAWQQAHECLFDYYREIPDKEQPDTLEEMRPLFSAVAHGCAAGLQQRALDDVYEARIRRAGADYAAKQLGAVGEELALLAHFFDSPWDRVSGELNAADQAFVLNLAGFRLRAMGRLSEAEAPMEASVVMREKTEVWKSAAINAGNLSELLLTLGRVAEAVHWAERSVEWADRSEEWGQRMTKRTTHADALHQQGDRSAAMARFAEAEALQAERQSQYPLLYSAQGYKYCDVLLAEGDAADVLPRAEQTLEWATNWGLSVLAKSLDQLSIGRAHAQLAQQHGSDELHRGKAEASLTSAVQGLRDAGQDDYLMRGLFARAEFAIDQRDWPSAERDLTEAEEIAEFGGMRLFQCDAQLLRGRLYLARDGDVAAARRHADAAGVLIAETGYHRRDSDLVVLREAIEA